MVRRGFMWLGKGRARARWRCEFEKSRGPLREIGFVDRIQLKRRSFLLLEKWYIEESRRVERSFEKYLNLDLTHSLRRDIIDASG